RLLAEVRLDRRQPPVEERRHRHAGRLAARQRAVRGRRLQRVQALAAEALRLRTYLADVGLAVQLQADHHPADPQPVRPLEDAALVVGPLARLTGLLLLVHADPPAAGGR